MPANVNIASSRQEFRAWLEAHHASEDECWLRVRRGRCLTSGVSVMEWNFSARRFAIRWKAFVREGFEGLLGARFFVPLEGKAAQMSRRPSRAQKPLPAGRASARQENRGRGYKRPSLLSRASPELASLSPLSCGDVVSERDGSGALGRPVKLATFAQVADEKGKKARALPAAFSVGNARVACFWRPASSSAACRGGCRHRCRGAWTGWSRCRRHEVHARRHV